MKDLFPELARHLSSLGAAKGEWRTLRLEESAPPYANVVRRRKAFVADYKAFADEFVASFKRGIEGVQAKYRANRRAFDCLFSNRPYDMAGSGAYRWAKILERLDNADPARVADVLSQAISQEE